MVKSRAANLTWLFSVVNDGTHICLSHPPGVSHFLLHTLHTIRLRDIEFAGGRQPLHSCLSLSASHLAVSFKEEGGTSFVACSGLNLVFPWKSLSMLNRSVGGHSTTLKIASWWYKDTQ